MSGYSADLMLKASAAPSNQSVFSCVGKHSFVMSCHVLISMYDMQEFAGEHLHKLALSSTEAKASIREDHRVRKEGESFRMERGGWWSIAQPVYERIFGRLPKNVMRIVPVCNWPLPIISCL